MLLSDNQVFLSAKPGYYVFPDANHNKYDQLTQLQPMQDLLELLGIFPAQPLQDFARCYAVEYKGSLMLVVMLMVSSDVLSMHFAPHRAFHCSADVIQRSGNYSITTAHIMQAIIQWRWIHRLNMIPLSMVMPYRIVLQSSQSKNIFLQLVKDQGYSRLPGSTTNETEQKAVAHELALAKAIVGPKHDIKSYDLGNTRYIIVTVPAHSGQIRSD